MEMFFIIGAKSQNLPILFFFFELHWSVIGIFYMSDIKNDHDGL